MKEILGLALAVYFFHLIFLAASISAWLTIAACLGLLWKMLSLRLGLGNPPRALIVIIGSMALFLALLDGPRFWHKETATGFIVILTLMVLLDRPGGRQIMVAHGGFFGMLVALLLASGPPLPLFIYFFLTLLIIFSLMLHHLPSRAIASLWELSRGLLKTALPVSAVFLTLYVFFPDIRPNPADRAITGLADTLEPGRIAALALSDRVAFRVRFSTETQDARLGPLYWRAAVLEENAGMSWHRGPLINEVPQPPRRLPAPFIYEMLTEPRLGSTLPLLEHTVYARPARQTELGVFGNPAQRTFRSAHSLLEVGSDRGPSFVPPTHPPPPQPQFQTSQRMKRWAQALRSRPVAAQIEAVLAHLRQYRYSLEPGRLDSDDPLDEFLFSKRLGYCEHFAASFASLLQLAGTPARIITGFQGGTALGNTGFYLVLDSDAHAWVEVWMGDRWQRVDPSLAVPGSDLQKPASQLWSALPFAYLSYGSRWLGGQLRDLTQDIQTIWLLLFTLAGLLLIFQILRLWRRRLSSSLWKSDLDRLLLTLKRQGLSRQGSETMADFFARAQQIFPHEQALLQETLRLYNQNVYGPLVSPAEEIALQHCLQNLRKRLRQQI